MICLFHNDLDGLMSAACVANLHGHGKDCKYICMDYKDSFDLTSVEDNEEVWILDFSLPVGDMVKLIKTTDKVVWIDHHKTAIDKYNNDDFMMDCSIAGARSIEYAACFLTHWYLSIGPRCLEEHSVPLAIALAADYDTWKFAFGDRSLFFNYGMKTYNARPEDSMLQMLLLDARGVLVDQVVERGKVVKDYLDIESESLLADIGFIFKLDDKEGLAINRGRINSKFFAKAVDNYDLVCGFVFDGARFTVSLYSIKIDVSLIAKKFGGGGHTGAAGFVCYNLPLEFVRKATELDFISPDN